MQINSLLLSLAAPVASRTIDAAATAVQTVGASFVDALRGSGASQGDRQTPVDSESSGFEGQLSQIAGRLRSLLSGMGVSGDFKLRMDLAHDGTASAGVTGPSAPEVVDALQDNAALLDELQIAMRQQQTANSSSQTGKAPHLSAVITGESSSHWSML